MEDFRKPKLCPQEVHIDEVQEDLLDNLSDAWGWHGDQSVDCEERDIVQVAPDELDEERPSKKLKWNKVRNQISNLSLEDLEPPILNLGHYRLLYYKCVMKRNLHYDI